MYSLTQAQTTNTRICVRVGIRNNLPRIRLHDIRHLIGTYSINYLKIPIEQVSFTLGHTNIITTQKYITANVRKSKETIENLLKSISE